MPNGGSWDRFWFVLVGFRNEFGHWPTRVRLPIHVVEALAAHLSPTDRAKVEAKLELVPGDALVAEDDEGARYEYMGPTTPLQERPSDWLRIKWD